jgi:hypothetical protein
MVRLENRLNEQQALEALSAKGLKLNSRSLSKIYRSGGFSRFLPDCHTTEAVTT